jgi:glycosyltransferase involved in cell wall biosynthesis
LGQLWEKIQKIFIVKIGLRFKKMVSILLATYSGHRFIKESLDSVLNQTYDQFEILIGLNGENGETKKILKDYSDPRIRIFDYGDDKGKAKTLNKLVKESKYEIIGIQDDDDIWTPEKLKKQIEFLKGYDVVGSFIEYINVNKGPWIENGVHNVGPNLSSNHEGIIKGILSGSNQIANTSAIFKKKDVLRVDGWDESLDGIEDFDFWVKLVKGGKKFINIPEVLVLHRIHRTSNFNYINTDLKNQIKI